MKALLALLLVACSGGTHAPPATLKGSAEPPVAERATPAPSITFADDQFELHGFPAIAKDRSVVALPVIESDGGRGYPNLRIELRFDSDKTFETIPVMISNDYEALVENGAAKPELVRRIERANQRLRDLHAKSDLVTMEPGEDLENEFVINTTWEIRYVNGMLKLVFDVDHSISFDRPDFKAPKGPHCAGCMPCENPESLHRVYWAPGINAIVVEIAYQGTDTCWEPGNQLHVLTW
ncbi:MAG TPA: hypothetical protein VL326_36605 [Kofleriaceae bacterium]|nr:hypothetical protein [Kofleriaceae bacterium]